MGHLNQVLLTKPAEVVQEACQVMEKHGCYVEKELKSELYYSNSTQHAHMHTQTLVALEALRTTSSFLHTGHLIIVDYLLVASLTPAMVDASTIIDNEQCRLAGLSIILFAGKLFANCNLSAKCVTLVPQKFPLFGMLPLKC